MTHVVAALIWDGGRFLICQRPPGKKRALLWEFVGGKVEEGETKEQALARECMEELGIEVDVGDEFMSVFHKYPDVEISLTIFNARIKSGRIKLLEHNAASWITPDETENYEFCPADKDILARIKELNKKIKRRRLK